MSVQTQDTVTGKVDPDVLTYTVGEDPVLDLELVEWDCIFKVIARPLDLTDSTGD